VENKNAATNRVSNPTDFLCGLYVFEFDSAKEAGCFIKRYSACPVWPIVTRGIDENQVFVLAMELKHQMHGDFSQEHNTLVKHPHYLGASVVRFRWDDSLMALFKGYELETGISDTIPCGSNCEACDSYKAPCRGCPAYHAYSAVHITPSGQ
jgi:hypothetical protein